MTDISVRSEEYLTDSRPWLEFEANGVSGPVGRNYGTLDFSAFTAATHYPKGFIPSGLALAWNGASTRLVLPTTAGAGAAAGLLYAAVRVPSDLTRKVSVALVDCFAVVRESRLPANHGVTSTVKTALPRIQFRA